MNVRYDFITSKGGRGQNEDAIRIEGHPRDASSQSAGLAHIVEAAVGKLPVPGRIPPRSHP